MRVRKVLLVLVVHCTSTARVHKNKSMQLHTMGSVTAEFEVRHRWRTTTLFSGRYALNAEHVHARSLQKLHLFDWHFRLGLHFACTCSSKYSVQRWVQTLEDKRFSFFRYRLTLAVMTNFEFCRDSIHSKTTESCILLFLCTLVTCNSTGKSTVMLLMHSW